MKSQKHKRLRRLRVFTVTGLQALMCCGLALLTYACANKPADEGPSPAEIRSMDSLAALNSAAADAVQLRMEAGRKLKITYQPYAISSSADLKAFRADYSKEQQSLILAFNRLDSRHLHYGDTLIIPEPLYDSLLPYASFPRRIRELTFVPKFLLVSYRVQAYAAYEYGRLVRWGPSSLGKRRTPTPTGLFAVNWRSKKSISTIDSDWILPWNVNVMNFEGVSMHQYEMPGYPASHACMRLLENDAKWIYYWAESWILDSRQKLEARGTPVLIFGSYEFGKPTPWSHLPQKPDILQLDAVDLRPLRESISTILEWTSQRDAVLEKRKQAKAAKAAREAREQAAASAAAGGKTSDSTDSKQRNLGREVARDSSANAGAGISG